MGDEQIIPRKEVWLFAIEMEKKLRANEHKGHWRGETLDYLYMRLRGEYLELGSALTHNADAIEIGGECADVANFSMMIWDVMRDADREEVNKPTQKNATERRSRRGGGQVESPPDQRAAYNVQHDTAALSRAERARNKCGR